MRQQDLVVSQRLVWDLEELTRPVDSIPRFVEILEHYGIAYAKEDTLADLESRADFRAAIGELDGNGDPEGVKGGARAGLDYSLVSTQGFVRGELIVTNTTDETVSLTGKDLRVRLVPERKTSNEDHRFLGFWVSW